MRLNVADAFAALVGAEEPEQLQSALDAARPYVRTVPALGKEVVAARERLEKMKEEARASEKARHVEEHSMLYTASHIERVTSETTTEQPEEMSPELPPEYHCPITQEPMLDPVATADGQVYERSAIQQWLTLNSTSPLTGQQLEHTMLLPIIALRSAIQRALHSGT